MAQLWGGRFTKETDRLAYQFNASIHFDQRFLEDRMWREASPMRPCWQSRGS